MTNSSILKIPSPTPLAARGDAIAREFAVFSSWEERYKRLIARGKEMGALPEAMKDDDHRVRGCQSQVWLSALVNDQGQIVLRADSDALIVKGLISLLVEVYSLATPQQILQSPPNFLKTIGLDAHLSPSRANGLWSMVKQIMIYAAAFDSLAKSQTKDL